MSPFGLPDIELTKTPVSVAQQIVPVETARFASLGARQPIGRSRRVEGFEVLGAGFASNERLEKPRRSLGDVRALDVARAREEVRDDGMIPVGRFFLTSEETQQDRCEGAGSGRNRFASVPRRHGAPSAR